MKGLKIMGFALLVFLISSACESVCIECSYDLVGGGKRSSGEVCTDEASADILEQEWQDMANAEGTTAVCERL